jgi:hypothetical protein
MRRLEQKLLAATSLTDARILLLLELAFSSR